jgi:hypothetical protein
LNEAAERHTLGVLTIWHDGHSLERGGDAKNASYPSVTTTKPPTISVLPPVVPPTSSKRLLTG